MDDPSALSPSAALSALFAPLGADAFFDRYYEREPLHLRGDGARGRGLLTHDALVAALASRPEPPEGLMAFPEHLRAVPEGRGPLTVAELLGDPALFRAYLDEGHPIVWNRARGVAPGIDALAAALSQAIGAHVWPNVYSTGTGGRPLDTHFDSHEVIAVHCEGTKCWRISAVRVDRPLDAGEMEEAIAAALAARRDEAIARPLLSFSVAPGDVVYIPRGQFHDASTPAGRSLHVTFGIRHLTGFDVAKLLSQLALAEPLLREYLPAALRDPGGDRTTSAIAEILARLCDLAAGGDLARAIAGAQAHLVRRSASP